MGLDVEDRGISAISSITTLEIEYSICVGTVPAVSDLFDNIKSNINEIKDSAVDAINDKLNNMMSGTAMYALQCAAQSLPAIGSTLDTFNQSMTALTTIAKGDFFGDIDTGIASVPSGLSCVDLSINLSGLNELCDSILSKLTSLISEFDVLEELQGLIINSLATIGGLLGCGSIMFDGLNGLNSSITDINDSIKHGLAAVNEAKIEGITSLDISTIAKEKIVEKLNLNNRMSEVKNNLISKVADLG